MLGLELVLAAPELLEVRRLLGNELLELGVPAPEPRELLLELGPYLDDIVAPVKDADVFGGRLARCEGERAYGFLGYGVTRVSL